MGFTISSWLEERWSRRAADTLISYGPCWNPSLGNWDGNCASAWNASGEDEFRTAHQLNTQHQRLFAGDAVRFRSRVSVPVKSSWPAWPDVISATPDHGPD